MLSSNPFSPSTSLLSCAITSKAPSDWLFECPYYFPWYVYFCYSCCHIWKSLPHWVWTMLACKRMKFSWSEQLECETPRIENRISTLTKKCLQFVNHPQHWTLSSRNIEYIAVLLEIYITLWSSLESHLTVRAESNLVPQTEKGQQNKGWYPNSWVDLLPLIKLGAW